MTIGILLQRQSSHERGEKERLAEKQVKAKRVTTGFAVTTYARATTLGGVYLPLKMCFFDISERKTNTIFPVMDKRPFGAGARAISLCFNQIPFY